MSEQTAVRTREKWVDDVKSLPAYWLCWGKADMQKGNTCYR